jgi:hypothetical protein
VTRGLRGRGAPAGPTPTAPRSVRGAGQSALARAERAGRSLYGSCPGSIAFARWNVSVESP